LRLLLFEGEFSYFNEPRSDFFTRMLSVFYLASFSNYWIATAFLSITSFALIWAFIVRFSDAMEIDSRVALVAFLIFPSVIFWTSGIVKETVSFALQSIILWSVVPLAKSQKIRFWDLMIGIISMWLLFQIKYYHAAILSLILAPAILYFRLGAINSNLTKSIILASSVLLILIALGESYYNLNFTRVGDIIVKNHNLLLQKSSPEKAIILEGFDNSVIGYLLSFPEAIFSGLFRPLPWEAWNLSSLTVSVENLIILILFLYIFRYWKFIFSPRSIQYIPVIVFVLSMATLIAFSTPNFGTLARYKVVYMPFFLTIILNQFPLFRNKKIHTSN